MVKLSLVSPPGFPETPNQAALLRALLLPGAKLVGNAYGKTPVMVMVPGVPSPIYTAEKHTVRACIKRRWLTGSNQDGYSINGLGIIAARST